MSEIVVNIDAPKSQRRGLEVPSLGILSRQKSYSQDHENSAQVYGSKKIQKRMGNRTSKSSAVRG